MSNSCHCVQSCQGEKEEGPDPVKESWRAFQKERTLGSGLSVKREWGVWKYEALVSGRAPGIWGVLSGASWVEPWRWERLGGQTEQSVFSPVP